MAERLAEVRTRVAAAERAAGRPAGSVTLVAVSKTTPIEAIEEAYAAGQRDFGESYAQELDRKARALAHLPTIRWHFIGNLQRNKAKVVASHAFMMHTLDSAELAVELERRLAAFGRSLDVLVEVNVAREPQKHGIDPSEVEALVAGCSAHPRLRVRGLMTVPPADDNAAAERCFRELAGIGRGLESAFGGPSLFSMGMSDDLELAVACGATHVRVGTAIFGARSYAKGASVVPAERANLAESEER